MSERKREKRAQPEENEEVDPAVEVDPRDDEIRELKDRYLRTLAELDNYRKRVEREREQSRLFAVEGLLRQILPVLDSLRLAVVAEGDADAIREGVDLALTDALRILREKGLQPIEALGRPFDPYLHEAVGMVPDREHPPGTVVAEIAPGYKLHDRVLRPSRVHVAVAPPGDPAGGEGSGDDPSPEETP